MRLRLKCVWAKVFPSCVDSISTPKHPTPCILAHTTARWKRTALLPHVTCTSFTPCNLYVFEQVEHACVLPTSCLIVVPGFIEHPSKRWTAENWICWFSESTLILPNSVGFTEFCWFYQILSTLPKFCLRIFTTVRTFPQRNSCLSVFEIFLPTVHKSTKSTNSSNVRGSRFLVAFCAHGHNVRMKESIVKRARFFSTCIQSR